MKNTWSSNMPRKDSSKRPTFANDLAAHQRIAGRRRLGAILDQPDQQPRWLDERIRLHSEIAELVARGRVRVPASCARSGSDRRSFPRADSRPTGQSARGASPAARRHPRQGTRCNGRARGRAPGCAQRSCRDWHAVRARSSEFDPGPVAAKSRAMSELPSMEPSSTSSSSQSAWLCSSTLAIACARKRSSLRKMMMAETSGASFIPGCFRPGAGAADRRSPRRRVAGGGSGQYYGGCRQARWCTQIRIPRCERAPPFRWSSRRKDRQIP